MKLLLVFLVASVAFAHCDSLDGPVVKAGRAALDRADLRLALAWVQPAAELETRAAFDRALAVRKLNADSRALADTYFLETLVRLHRAGEGAPYTGLQPAGRDLGPAIPAADRALATGALDPLLAELKQSVEHGLHTRFERARAAAKFKPEDVEAGRAYVKAYVDFIHYVEGVHEAAAPPAGHAH